MNQMAHQGFKQRHEPCTRDFERDKTIIQLFADGEEPKQIAHKLGISSQTVSYCIVRLRREAAVNTNCQLVAHALRKGIIK